MIEIKVYFDNKDSLSTRINATFEEAEKYYVGNVFNIGSVSDKMVKCNKIELIEGDKIDS